MADSTWHVARSMILKEDNDIFVNNFETAGVNSVFCYGDG